MDAQTLICLCLCLPCIRVHECPISAHTHSVGHILYAQLICTHSYPIPPLFLRVVRIISPACREICAQQASFFSFHFLNLVLICRGRFWNYECDKNCLVSQGACGGGGVGDKVPQLPLSKNSTAVALRLGCAPWHYFKTLHIAAPADVYLCIFLSDVIITKFVDFSTCPETFPAIHERTVELSVMLHGCFRDWVL